MSLREADSLSGEYYSVSWQRWKLTSGLRRLRAYQVRVDLYHVGFSQRATYFMVAETKLIINIYEHLNTASLVLSARSLYGRFRGRKLNAVRRGFDTICNDHFIAVFRWVGYWWRKQRDWYSFCPAPDRLGLIVLYVITGLPIGQYLVNHSDTARAGQIAGANVIQLQSTNYWHECNWNYKLLWNQRPNYVISITSITNYMQLLILFSN